MQNRKRDRDVQNRLLDCVGEGKDGMFQENNIETCILSRMKQITSPGWMHETGAQGWCNVWQKPLQYCKVISLQLIKINGKKNTVFCSLCLKDPSQTIYGLFLSCRFHCHWSACGCLPGQGCSLAQHPTSLFILPALILPQVFEWSFPISVSFTMCGFSRRVTLSPKPHLLPHLLLPRIEPVPFSQIHQTFAPHQTLNMLLSAWMAPSQSANCRPS